MSQPHRVLCAVDFSRSARGAFERALAISRDRDAELTVVHAVPATERYNWRARARIAMADELRAAAHAAGVSVRITEQQGDPAGVILLHAATARADLIVLGNGQAGADRERRRAGSIAERVTERATCPVLIVPASDRQDDAPATWTNIVCPVSFTPGSDLAVEQARRLVKRGGRVTLVHVARPSRYEYPFSIPARERWLMSDARQRLEDAVLADTRSIADVRVQMASGRPATEIARVASEVDADLIVMGVTARGAIGRTLLGSTTARVIRETDRPLLAVPERMLDRGGLDQAA